MHPGIVSMRVVFVLRSAEIFPVFLRFVLPYFVKFLDRVGQVGLLGLVWSFASADGLYFFISDFFSCSVIHDSATFVFTVAILAQG